MNNQDSYRTSCNRFFMAGARSFFSARCKMVITVLSAHPNTAAISAVDCPCFHAISPEVLSRNFPAEFILIPCERSPPAAPPPLPNWPSVACHIPIVLPSGYIPLSALRAVCVGPQGRGRGRRVLDCSACFYYFLITSRQTPAVLYSKWRGFACCKM